MRETAARLSPAAGVRPRAGALATRILRRRRVHGPIPLAAAALLIAAAVNLPLIYLLLRTMEAGAATFLDVVVAPSTLRLVLQTLGLVVGVCIASSAIALPLAWLIARTDVPGRRMLGLLSALPLAVPSYVAAFAVIAVAGPRGALQRGLEPFGVTRLPEWAYGYSGALVTLTLFSYPYIYLPVLAALRRLDPALEESSRSLGHGAWSTFWHLILPQLRIPLASGALLVALYTLSDFGAVSLTRFDTLTLGVYRAYASLFDRSIAAVLAGVLVLLTLLLVSGKARIERGSRPPRGDAQHASARLPLGRLRWPCLLGVSGLCLLTLGLPVGVALASALRALHVGNPLSSPWWPALNSVLVAAAAAAIATLLSLAPAAWSVRYPTRLSRITENLTYAGNALPGIVIALSFVFLASRWLTPLYQTMSLLVAAYVVRFLPEALVPTRGGFASIAPAHLEAARGLGIGRLAVIRRVTLPLLRPGLLAGFGLVFLTAMKELPAALLLRPIGFDTLATRVWSATAEGAHSEAALPSLLLLLVSMGPVYLLVIRPMLGERV